jgi:hypothetical protein
MVCWEDLLNKSLVLDSRFEALGINKALPKGSWNKLPLVITSASL